MILPANFRGLDEDIPLGAHNEIIFARQCHAGEWEEIQRLREEWVNGG